MDRKRSLKRRNILYLIEAYLSDHKYKITSDCLKSEAELTNEYKVCDNISLESIIVDFEAFYFQRFNKFPQMCKKINSDIQTSNSYVMRKNGSTSQNCIQAEQETDKTTIKNAPKLVLENSLAYYRENCDTLENLMPTKNDWISNNIWREYADFVLQNTRSHNVSVHWDDVKGLEAVKKLLKEAVIYPVKYSRIFTDIIEPWKSILLYGPPGTGKTLLAMAAATESSATFLKVSSSILVSKWRGDTEKLVKVLFEMALKNAPSIIFIDEVDSLTLEGSTLEHEASRRMKSEIFAGMDRVAQNKSNVVLLASTNTPWDIDKAMLRRFEKHVYIPYPGEKTRKLLFEHFLPKIINEKPVICTDMDYDFIAQETENFSGSDIKNLCKEIKMHYVRDIIDTLESNHSLQTPISSNTKITKDQIKKIVQNMKPVITHSQEKYSRWNRYSENEFVSED